MWTLSYGEHEDRSRITSSSVSPASRTHSHSKPSAAVPSSALISTRHTSSGIRSTSRSRRTRQCRRGTEPPSEKRESEFDDVSAVRLRAEDHRQSSSQSRLHKRRPWHTDRARVSRRMGRFTGGWGGAPPPGANPTPGGPGGSSSSAPQISSLAHRCNSRRRLGLAGT